MGVVYQAKEPHSGRIVALKCVLAYQGDSDHVVARFRREAETPRGWIIPILSPFIRSARRRMAFPIIQWSTAPAGSLLQARGPLLQHPRQSAALMVKVARAVHYAHERGVLHRDLKPGNILLDDHGEPLVSDFGLARCEAASSYLTRSLASFGTPGYIAPEQADGPAAHLTPAADVYSLGAILFELFTGRPPFVGDNAFAVMKQSSQQPAPKVRTFARNVDRDLETICARCLEREPADRYQSAASLADDLQSWLDNRPIVARPAGLWLQSRRWVRHNRGLAALLVAFCLLAAGSLVWHSRAQKAATAMKANMLVARSVAVLPFYDLDTASPDPGMTKAFANSLQTALAALGPSQVTTLEPGFALSRERIGELINDGAENRRRAVVTGTVRMVQGRQRVSFQLIDPASGETLFSHLWEQEGQQNSISNALTKEINQAIHAILSATDWSDLIRSNSDPGLRNEKAREAITAGRLIPHLSASDCDKRMGLFRKALEAEPNSSLAHAYIAMEATNRLHFNPDRSFLDLGKRGGRNRPSDVSGICRSASGSGRRLLSGRKTLRSARAVAPDDRNRRIAGSSGVVYRHDPGYVGAAAPGFGLEPGGGATVRKSRRRGLLHRRLLDQAGRRSTSRTGLFPRERAAAEFLRWNSGDGAPSITARQFRGSAQLCRGLPVVQAAGEIAAQVEFFDRKFDVALELYRTLDKANPNGGGTFYGAMTYCSAGGRAKQALGEVNDARGFWKSVLPRSRQTRRGNLATPTRFIVSRRWKLLWE